MPHIIIVIAIIAITTIFAVSQIMFLIVADQIIQSVTIVRCDKVDAVEWGATITQVQV